MTSQPKRDQLRGAHRPTETMDVRLPLAPTEPTPGLPHSAPLSLGQVEAEGTDHLEKHIRDTELGLGERRTAPPAAPPTRPPSQRQLLRARLSTRAALQEAFLLAEILGPPKALRRPEE